MSSDRSQVSERKIIQDDLKSITKSKIKFHFLVSYKNY